MCNGRVQAGDAVPEPVYVDSPLGAAAARASPRRSPSRLGPLAGVSRESSAAFL